MPPETTQKTEPLLTEVDEFEFSWDNHPKAKKYYNQFLSSIWVAENVPVADDEKNKHLLSEPELEMLLNVLTFFVAGDKIVFRNLGENFNSEIKSMAVDSVYTLQKSHEFVHTVMYSTLFTVYTRDKSHRSELIASLETSKHLKKKIDWAEKWMNNKRPFATRVFAFACVEGIFFSSSFAMIFWLKRKYSDKLRGLCLSNDYIFVDETNHYNFSLYVYYAWLLNHLTSEEAYEIVREAVDAECDFVVNATKREIQGLLKEDLVKYVEFTGDVILKLAGYDPLYNTKNSCDWMETQVVKSETNEFELESVEYKATDVEIPPYDDNVEC